MHRSSVEINFLLAYSLFPLLSPWGTKKGHMEQGLVRIGAPIERSRVWPNRSWHPVQWGMRHCHDGELNCFSTWLSSYSFTDCSQALEIAIFIHCCWLPVYVNSSTNVKKHDHRGFVFGFRLRSFLQSQWINPLMLDFCTVCEKPQSFISYYVFQQFMLLFRGFYDFSSNVHLRVLLFRCEVQRDHFWENIWDVLCFMQKPNLFFINCYNLHNSGNCRDCRIDNQWSLLIKIPIFFSVFSTNVDI